MEERKQKEREKDRKENERSGVNISDQHEARVRGSI